MHSMHTTTTSGLAAPSHTRPHVAPAAVPVAPRQQKQLSSPQPGQHHRLQHQPQQERRRAVRVCVAQQEVVVVDPIPALEPPAAANKSTGWRAGLGEQVAACASVCLCVCVFVYGAEGREEAQC